MEQERVGRFLEFFSIGIGMGIIEDVIVVALVTNDPITVEMIGVVVLVALPVAGISELIVDRPGFDYFERLATWITTRFS